jgi:DinB superfamily
MPDAEIRVPLFRVLQDLEDSERQASAIMQAVSNHQANWQPLNSWSMVQCLLHLAQMNRVYSTPIHEAVANADTAEPAPERIIAPGWFGSWFIRSMEPPVRTRMKSPRSIVPDGHARDPQEVLSDFLASHQPVRALAEAASRVEVNKVRFKNPFLSVLRFTVGTGLLIINAHDRRHLWQANQIKNAPGFPPE